MKNEVKLLNKIRKLMTVLYFAMTIIFIAITVSLNILPIKYLIPMITLLLLLLGLGLYSHKLGKFSRISMSVSILLSIILLIGSVYLMKVDRMFEKISGIDARIDTVSINVLKKDTAESVADATGYKFGILNLLDRINTNKTVQIIGDLFSCELHTVQFEDFAAQVKALYGGEVKAIIINEAFRETIKEIFPDFDEKTKVLGYQNIETKFQSKRKDEANSSSNNVSDEVKHGLIEDNIKKTSEDVIIVYFSGIDTSGPIEKSGRSDSNIIAVVNTKTKKILLINTPRDYFVMIPVDGGQMDKLTHAGIYGVEVSIGALEKLYDIEIDYYVRVNHSTLIEIVNALDGIVVESEYEFKTFSYSFVKGENELNGEKALSFSRARYQFASGDNQRGENQMAVITAIFNKAKSPEVITKIGNIIEAVSKSFETNIPYNKIYGLIKMQMNDNSIWDVETFSVKGTGESRATYSGGNQKLYVMIPNKSSVDEVKGNISQIIDLDIE